MRNESVTKQVAAAVDEGWVEGGSFVGSILAGTLLGFGLDRLVGTAPWLVVAGILAGSYAGFVRMWRAIQSQPLPEAVTLKPIEESE